MYWWVINLRGVAKSIILLQRIQILQVLCEWREQPSCYDSLRFIRIVTSCAQQKEIKTHGLKNRRNWIHCGILSNWTLSAAVLFPLPFFAFLQCCFCLFAFLFLFASFVAFLFFIFPVPFLPFSPFPLSFLSVCSSPDVLLLLLLLLSAPLSAPFSCLCVAPCFSSPLPLCWCFTSFDLPRLFKPFVSPLLPCSLVPLAPLPRPTAPTPPCSFPYSSLRSVRPLVARSSSPVRGTFLTIRGVFSEFKYGSSGRDLIYLFFAKLISD